MLTHLAAIFIKDVAKAENRFVRALIEYQSTDCHQRVEPAASLVDRLGDEICGVGGFKLLDRAGLMRVSPLGKWHCARVVPTVDDFIDSNHGLGTFSTWNGDVINKWTMWIRCRELFAAQG